MNDSEEVKKLKQQLAERDALLSDISKRHWSGVDFDLPTDLVTRIAALCASAEPSAAVEIDHDALVAAVCVLRSQGLGNLSAAVEEARAALERNK